MKILSVRWDRGDKTAEIPIDRRQGIAVTDEGEVTFCGNIFDCPCGKPRIRRESTNAAEARSHGRDGFEYLLVLCGLSPAWQDWYGVKPVEGQPVIEVENDGKTMWWQ